MAVTAMRGGSGSQERGPRINVGGMERWLSMVAAGVLAAYAFKRREKPGGAAALASAALLYRGTTGHCPMYQGLGVNSRGGDGVGELTDRESDTRQQLSGRRGIHVQESVTINLPIGEVYRFWRNFENLPKFMAHLSSVSVREQGISHWVATRTGRHQGRVGRAHHQRNRQQADRLAVAASARPFRPPARSTSTRPNTERASVFIFSTTRRAVRWAPRSPACSAKSRTRPSARTCDACSQILETGEMPTTERAAVRAAWREIMKALCWEGTNRRQGREGPRSEDHQPA